MIHNIHAQEVQTHAFFDLSTCVQRFNTHQYTNTDILANITLILLAVRDVDIHWKQCADEREVAAEDGGAVAVVLDLLGVAVEPHVVREKLCTQHRDLVRGAQLRGRIELDREVVGIADYFFRNA